MKVGVPRETWPGEHRVALIPSAAAALKKSGLDVVVEQDAGARRGISLRGLRAGRRRRSRRATPCSRRPTSFCRCGPSRPSRPGCGKGQVVIGFADPLGEPDAIRVLAQAGVTAFSMELMPRITRAQSMDALSSMATIAGYKGVLLAANHLPRMFPMLMTAAGTLTAARVFIVGAGVAGLQAIATARRLGARVEAYDVRPAVKEQVQSLGARFVEMPLETGRRGGQGRLRQGAGRVVLPPPARDDAEGRRRQRRRHHDRADSREEGADPRHRGDGRRHGAGLGGRRPRGRARRQLRADPRRTRSSSTRASTILGPSNPPALVPNHASQMYSKNITTFLSHLLGKDGAKKPSLELDLSDEITRETLLTRDGDVVHARVKDLLGAAAR